MRVHGMSLEAPRPLQVFTEPTRDSDHVVLFNRIYPGVSV